MRQWEYAIVSLSVEERTELLDSYGERGWELVSVVQDPDHQTLAFFKRLKIDTGLHDAV